MSELVKIEDAAVNYNRAPLSARQAYIMQLAQARTLLPRAVVNPASYEETAAQTFYIAEVGAMMGIHPLEALSGIHMIEGRWTVSAGLMSSLVRQAGHKLRVTESGSWRDGSYVARCVIVRNDDPDFEHVAEFGFEDAEMAGMTTKKGPWQQYPKAMCKARAISACARAAAEDALGGARYTPEELGAEVNDEGEPINIGHVEVDQMPQPQQAQQPQPQRSPQQDEPQPPAAASSTGTAPAAAAEQVPDEKIVAALPDIVVAHARSAWQLFGTSDTEAITGVWKSAQAARIMAHPAIAFPVDGADPVLWERDEHGKPKNLGTMLRWIASGVKQRAEAESQDAAAESPQVEPEASEAPAAPADENVIDAEIVDESGESDPAA